jgi:hypothetical protein
LPDALMRRLRRDRGKTASELLMRELEARARDGQALR